MAACRPLRLIYGAPQRPISAAAGGRVRDAVDQSVRRPALPTGSQRLPIDPPRAGSPTFPTWSEIPRHAATHTDFVTVETERHHVAREHRAAVTAERAGACGGEMDHGCSNGTSHGMRIKTSEGKKKEERKGRWGNVAPGFGAPRRGRRRERVLARPDSGLDSRKAPGIAVPKAADDPERGWERRSESLKGQFPPGRGYRLCTGRPPPNRFSPFS